MKLKSFRDIAFTAVMPLVLSIAASAQIHGAGATFPEPIYKQWFALYEKEMASKIDYEANGSGKGIEALKTKSVDFAASDAPLSEKEEKEMPGPVVHIPTVGGAVALIYNLKGVGTRLHFTPEIVVGIYLGDIKKWDDARIKAANPDVTLPAVDIKPIHRSDGSGTTYILTNYLAKVSSLWAKSPGEGKTIEWPVGQASKGNDGMLTAVQATEGAIGYTELAAAKDRNLPIGMIKNRAGKWVEPSAKGVTAAINAYAQELKENIKVPTVDAPGDDSYPICSLTYILFYQAAGNRAALQKLWSWALKPSQQAMAADRYYAGLPETLVKRNLEVLRRTAAN